MTERPRLTWYRGSVLPYASLYHTLLRACELNGLRPRQLAAMARARDRHEAPQPFGGIDRERLATLLGEPAMKFRWATVDDAPEWLRPALFGYDTRICSLCLAEGYHTDLFALRFLQTCPVHAVPLRSHCRCGRAFMMILSDPDGPPGSCPCDRLRFFTPELCRRPRMTSANMQAMDQLVAWLDGMTCLAHSEAVEYQCFWTQQLEPEELLALSEAMGHPCPPGLQPHPTRNALRVVDGPNTIIHNDVCHQQAFADSDLREKASSYWSDAPAFSVYRAMARHFRRHVAPRATKWLEAPTAAVAAETLAHHPQAALVITECLWARSVEPFVRLRRWPYRAPPKGEFGDLSDQVMLHASISHPSQESSATHTWIAYHAAASALLQMWAYADKAVQAFLLGRGNALRHVEIERCPLRPWWGAKRRCGITRFVEPVIDCSEAWGIMSRTSKAARLFRVARRRHRRRRAIVAQWHSQGTGLTFSRERGWTVATAFTPANADIRKRRLLGQQDVGAMFWIYRETGGDMVARLCDGRVQGIGETPRTAIKALRMALLRLRFLAPPH